MPKKSNDLNSRSGFSGCREIAAGVYCLEAGKGFMRANVYFIRSGSSWVLIDTASINCSRLIIKAAESLFGKNARPTSILITHDHPDHAGSVLELARIWKCPVYLHPGDMQLATHASMETFQQYANPLDRWVVLPIMRAMPRRRFEAMISNSSLKDIVAEFEPTAAPPGLPDWKCIPTPGHTPGHVAFFRANDRVLITGDAVVTVQLNSIWGMLQWSLYIKRQRVFGPPWYSTWNKPMAKESVVRLAELQPEVLASGHGMPMTGDRVIKQLKVLAKRYAG